MSALPKEISESETSLLFPPLTERSSEWNRFLWQFKIEDFLGKAPEEIKKERMSKVVHVHKDDSVWDVLGVLTKHSILSAPVFDKQTNTFVPILSLFFVSLIRPCNMTDTLDSLMC